MFKAVLESFGLGKPDKAMQEVQVETVTVEFHQMMMEQRDAAVGKQLGRYIKAVSERNAAYIALRDIVEAETPNCANIGKKMARIAREALPEYAEKEAV